MVAGVSIFTFHTIGLPITRALSSGFSVGASLNGENLFDVLIGTEERCFDPWLGRLTITQLSCWTGSFATEQSTGLPELVASKAVFTALTFLLSLTKVWMRVSSSKIFSVSLTISLHLSHVNPSLLKCERVKVIYSRHLSNWRRRGLKLLSIWSEFAECVYVRGNHLWSSFIYRRSEYKGLYESLQIAFHNNVLVSQFRGWSLVCSIDIYT